MRIKHLIQRSTSISFIFIFILFHSGLFAQKRLGIYEIDMEEYKAENNKTFGGLFLNTEALNSIKSISNQLISAYSGDPSFIVIDKRNSGKVLLELERQKKEEFIDGYTIAQGKQEGIDYIMVPKYIAADNSISVLVLDVATGTVFCKASTMIKNKGEKAVNFYSAILIQQLNEKCFNVSFPVVRVLKAKGNKAKEILIAIGKSQNVKKGYKLDIFEITTEQVGENRIERKVIIGQTEIINVEDDNFSVSEVLSGGDIIQEKLTNSINLYCKLIEKK